MAAVLNDCGSIGVTPIEGKHECKLVMVNPMQ